jgi:hypothetical protein
VRDFVRVTKPNASAPAPEDDAARLAGRCAAVVTAIGD